MGSQTDRNEASGHREGRHCAAVPVTVNDRRGGFHRIRDPIMIPLPLAQAAMTERDEQPIPVGYNLPSLRAWLSGRVGC